MENIISALISAVAAMVVALISKTPGRSDKGNYAPRFQPSGQRKWLIAMWLIAGWLIISPIAIHHDFPEINLFGLLALTAIIAAVWPINGIKAASWIFALHALNSVAEPIARIVTGYKYNPFGGYNLEGILIITALAVVNAVGVGYLCQWRLRIGLGTTVNAAPHGADLHCNADRENKYGATKADSDFVLQLERLSKLHDEGKISDEEHLKAKQKVLDNL